MSSPTDRDAEAGVAKGKGRATESDRQMDENLLEGIKEWEGPSLFVQSSTSTLPRSPGRRLIATAATIGSPSTPTTPSKGDFSSPISVSSSSPSPDKLPRPRAVPKYASPLPRTAYTPPRPPAASPPRNKSNTTSSSAVRSPQRVFPASLSAASSSSRPGKPGAAPADDRNISSSSSSGLASTSKPLHPFFAHDHRAKSLPLPVRAPPTNRPRLVAHYSSTSESRAESQSTDYTGSTMGSSLPPPRLDIGIEELAEEVERLEIRATTHASARWDWEATRARQSGPPRSNAANSTTKQTPTAPPAVLPLPVRPEPLSTLPLFSHRTFSHPPPRVAYTISFSEADDLLSCLRGPVIGLDLEWPSKTEKRWDRLAGKYVFEQAKTALVQICDARMVILIHLRQSGLPEKLVQMLQDPTLYKVGVAVVGADARKLVRDFPSSFPEGISGLVELSDLARRADPINAGPGKALISLAKLCRVYLGHDLDKTSGVRGSDWAQVLTSDQIEYAANDAYVGYHICKRLQEIASESRIALDLDTLSVKVTVPVSSTAPSKAATDVSTTRTPNAPSRALAKFLAGQSVPDIASEAGIKETTIQTYLCRAVEASPPDALSLDAKARVLGAIPDGVYAASAFRKLLARLRKEVAGEADGADESDLTRGSAEPEAEVGEVNGLEEVEELEELGPKSKPDSIAGAGEVMALPSGRKP